MFAAAFSKARAKDRRVRLATTEHKPSEYTKTYLSKDGKTGVALIGDEIVNLFSLGPPGAGRKALREAKAGGGRRLDCTGDFLRQFYEGEGFTVHDQAEFDSELAPDEWDTGKDGRPNIYFMEAIGSGVTPAPRSFDEEAKDLQLDLAARRLDPGDPYMVTPKPVLRDKPEPGDEAVWRATSVGGAPMLVNVRDLAHQALQSIAHDGAFDPFQVKTEADAKALLEGLRKGLVGPGATNDFRGRTFELKEAADSIEFAGYREAGRRPLNGEELEAVRRGLTPFEARAGNDYTSDLSREINTIARGDDPFPGEGSLDPAAPGYQQTHALQRIEARAAIPVMDSLIERVGVAPRTKRLDEAADQGAAPVPGDPDPLAGDPGANVLFRGINWDKLPPEARDALSTPGEEFDEGGFVSATYDRGTAEAFGGGDEYVDRTILTIKLDPEAKALYVPDYFSGPANQAEGEFVFPRGMRFRVDSATQPGPAMQFYTYKADEYSPEDLAILLRNDYPELTQPGILDDPAEEEIALRLGRAIKPALPNPVTEADIEPVLQFLADRQGIDRDDEASFDSDEFPKMGDYRPAEFNREIGLTMLPPASVPSVPTA